jgi:hypothetical protein
MSDINLDNLPYDVTEIIMKRLSVLDIIELKYVSLKLEKHVYTMYNTKKLILMLFDSYKNNRMGYTDPNINFIDLLPNGVIIESKLPQLVITDEAFEMIKTMVLFWRRGFSHNKTISSIMMTENYRLYNIYSSIERTVISSVCLADIMLVLISAYKGFKNIDYCMNITKDISVKNIINVNDLVGINGYCMIDYFIRSNKGQWRYNNWKQYPQIKNNMCVNTWFKYILYETAVIICNKLDIKKLNRFALAYLIATIRYNIIPVEIDAENELLPPNKYNTNISYYITDLLRNKENRAKILELFPYAYDQSKERMDYYDEIFT